MSDQPPEPLIPAPERGEKPKPYEPHWLLSAPEGKEFSGSQVVCNHCGHTVVPIPVEPLFDTWTAALLIPMSYRGLMSLLGKHRDKFPGRYRLVGSAHHRRRLLYASEIRRIRRMVIRGKLGLW